MMFSSHKIIAQNSIDAPYWTDDGPFTSRPNGDSRFGRISNVYFQPNGYNNNEENFTLLLSDADGSFTNQVEISFRSVVDISAGGLRQCETEDFPIGLPSSNRYRIKIKGPDNVVSPQSIDSLTIFSGELSATKTTFCLHDSSIVSTQKPKNNWLVNTHFKWFLNDNELYGNKDSTLVVRDSDKVYAIIYFVSSDNQYWEVFGTTDTIEITVHHYPKFTIEPYSPNGLLQISNNGSVHLCYGEQMGFNFTDVSGLNNWNINEFLYEWRQGNGDWQDEFSPDEGFLITPESGELMIRAKLNHNCGLDTAIMNVVVAPKVQSSFSLHSTACAGILTGMPENNVENPNNIGEPREFYYNWSIMPSYNYYNLPTSNSDENIEGYYFTSENTGSHQIILTVTDGFLGCNSIDTVDIELGMFQVQVSNHLLNDGTLVMAALANGGNVPYSYNWSVYDSCFSANCDTVLLNQNTILTVIDSLGCISIDTIQLKTPEFIVDDGNPLWEYLSQKDVNFIDKAMEVEDKFRSFIDDDKTNEYSLDKSNFPSRTVLIPVIFGIISNPNSIGAGPSINGAPNLGSTNNAIAEHMTAVSNTGETNLQAQLRIINEQFKNNPITYNGQLYTIQFCFATKDDLGNPVTNGMINVQNAELSYFVDRIYRTGLPHTNIPQIECLPDWEEPVPSSGGHFNYCGYVDRMAILTNFSYRKYLRIIVCDFDYSAGYGMTPSEQIGPLASEAEKQKIDGVILNYNVFYRQNPTHHFQMGRILVHEIGHWLNLHHPFHNFCEAYDAEINDINFSPMGGQTWDFVKDTPPQKSQQPATTWFDISTIQCKSHVPSSVYTNNPMPTNNHMDYRRDDNRTTFTPGQRERMIYSLAYFRNELYTIENLIQTGVACIGVPIAAFTLDKTTICGSGSNAQIVLKRLPNVQTNLTYAITTSAGSDVTISGNAEDLERTLTFATTSIGQARVTITLTVTQGSNNYAFTQEVFVYPNCEPCSNPSKENWFFGNYAGLHFNSTKRTPTANLNSFNSIPLTDRIEASGGVVSISDDFGSLLFYASGSSLWNKNHKKLDLNLDSDPNSSQFGVAAKAPDYSSANPVYYLFTVPANGGDNFNKGLRWHKVNVSSTNGINSTTPSFSNNDYNLPITVGPSGAPTGDDGAVLVSEKITLIFKENQRDFYLIVQGPPGNGTFSSKLYVYEVTSNGISFINDYDAGGAAEKGILKANVSGDKVISTYSNSWDPLTGYAVGADAEVYEFDKTSGALNLFRKLKRASNPSGITSMSSFGGAFSFNGDYVYLNINRERTYGASPVHFAGIYKYDLTSTPVNTNELLGTLVQTIQPGTSNSVDLALGPNRSIYVSNPAKQGFYAECCPNPSFGNSHLGVIHFPDNYANPGFTWNGPSLITNSTQTIRSRMALPNFAETGNGNPMENAFHLGINPELRKGGSSCCQTPIPFAVNIACMINSNNSYNEDVSYQFRVAKVGNVFPNLRVSTSLSDFATEPKLEYFNKSATPSPVWELWPAWYVSGNGKWRTILGSQISEWSGTDDFVDFKLIVESVNASSTGFFKTHIFIIDPQTGSNTIQDYPGILESCCRIAVGEEGNYFKDDDSMPKQSEFLYLFPNPVNSVVRLEWIGAPAAFQMIDMMGRMVQDGQLKKGSSHVNIEHLPAGIYQFIVSGSEKSHHLKFTVVK